jgi:hypothetical protein
MGGGHGYFEPIFILFPFSCISFIFLMRSIFVYFYAIQYPVYGLLLDKMKAKNTFAISYSCTFIFSITTMSLRPIKFPAVKNTNILDS